MTDPVHLRWTVGRGLSIPIARELRLVSQDGQLRLEEPGGATRVLGSTESLTAAYLRPADQVRSTRRWPADAADESWVGSTPVVGPARSVRLARLEMESADATGALVIADEAGPVVAVSLPEVMGAYAPLADGVRSSGVAALVASLGLTVGEAPPLDRAAESRVLVRPRRRLLAAARLVHALVLTSAVISLVAIVRDADWPGPAHLVAAALLVAGTVGGVLSRLAFLRTVRSRPEPAGRSVLTLPGSAQLQLGADEVVAVVPHDGEEHWYAGPAAGGVARAQVGTAQTWLTTADDHLVAAFDTADLVADDAARDRLLAACEAVGIEVVPSGLDADTGTATALAVRPSPGVPAAPLMSPRESGELGLTVPITTGLAAALGLIPAGGPGGDVGGGGWVLVAVHVGCLLAVGWGAWSLRHWRRSVSRTGAGR